MLLPNVWIDGELWNYFVSRQGKVYSLNYGGTGKAKELKQVILTINKKRKRLTVTLHKNKKRKTVYVSRLVAQAYIPNPDNLPQVDHIDRNPLNNDIRNLRWVTPTENLLNRGSVKRPNNNKRSKAVRCIETEEVFPSLMEVERKKGYYHGNVGSCCRGQYKTAYGLHWEYV